MGRLSLASKSKLQQVHLASSIEGVIDRRAEGMWGCPRSVSAHDVLRFFPK